MHVKIVLGGVSLQPSLEQIVVGVEACHSLVAALGDLLEYKGGHVLAGEVVSVFDVLADLSQFLGVALHRGSVQPEFLFVGRPALDVIPEEQAVFD